MKLNFRYSLIEDLRWNFRTLFNLKELKKKGVVVFPPSLLKLISLWLNNPKAIEIDIKYPITCYWISAGTWGAFTPPDKIFICPRKIEGGMYATEDLKRVIEHEIFHLYFYHETKDMDFENREMFINEKLNAQKK